MEPSIITFNNISKNYGDVKILHGVTLEIPKGSFTVMIGPSGCGKSTLLKILTGIETPTSGSVTRPSSMTMVFQNGSLLPWRTVYDNIALGLETSLMDDKAREHAIRNAMELMGLTNLEKSYPRDLSGGQRQRVGIARALISNPEVLLLDEPFSALDAETTGSLHGELLKLWKEKGLTIFMISHALDEAIELADTIHVMKAGTIIDTETVSWPRPRNQTDALFVSLREKLRTLLQK